MSAHHSSAEVLKLAHQLGVAPARLEFLGTVDAADLRALRSQIAEALFHDGRQHFAKAVAVSKVIPTALAARITEFALPPLIAARTAELLEPARAVDMVARLSDCYLADVSSAMDPARASSVIVRMPPERVATVGAELARRGEWVVMGGFVSHVSDEALRASVVDLTGEQLLRIGFVLDDVSRLEELAQLLTGWQLDDMLVAAAELDLWQELDEVLGKLDVARSAPLAARYAVAAPSVAAAAEAAATGGSLSSQSLAKLGGT